MNFRVGKRVGSKVVPAFDIARVNGGGVRFSNIRELTDSEQHLIMAHYGRPVRSKIVVRGEQHLRNLQPGTVRHFEHASYVLPDPFTLLPKGA
jgi:hypothetical protein